MEFLILFLTALLIAIVILPFIALAKANIAKRGIDDVATRLSSLENEVHSLRRHVVPAPEPDAAIATPKAFEVPPLLPITTPVPIEEEKKSVPPPIPKGF